MQQTSAAIDVAVSLQLGVRVYAAPMPFESVTLATAVPDLPVVVVAGGNHVAKGKVVAGDRWGGHAGLRGASQSSVIVEVADVLVPNACVPKLPKVDHAPPRWPVKLGPTGKRVKPTFGEVLASVGGAFTIAVHVRALRHACEQ